MSDRPPRYSFFTGVFVSLMFAALLTHSIMTGSIGHELTITEFLSNISNILYVIMMSLICLAAWLVTGLNNRIYILCWASGYVLNTLLFFVGLDYFFGEHKNVYILNILGFVSIVPLYLFCKFRIPFLNRVFVLLGNVKVINQWAAKSLHSTSVTALTSRLDFLIIYLVLIELLFSLVLTFWTLYYQVPVNGSVGQVLYESGHVDYFTYYYYVLDFWTTLFIISLARHIYLDVKTPDFFKAIDRSLVEKKLNKIRSKKSRRD